MQLPRARFNRHNICFQASEPLSLRVLLGNASRASQFLQWPSTQATRRTTSFICPSASLSLCLVSLSLCIMCPSLCSLSISFKILFGSLFSFPRCCARHQLYAIICGARLFAFAVLDLLQKAYGLLLWLLYQSGWSKNSKIPNIHVYVHICICIHTHIYMQMSTSYTFIIFG